MRPFIPQTSNPQAKFWQTYHRILQNRSSSIIYLLILVQGFLLTGAFSFLGAFIRQQFGLNNFLIGLIMTAFGVMAVAGGRISGRIAARVGRKGTIVVGLVIALAADLTFVAGANHLVGVIIGVGLLGLGLMTAHSTFLTIATEFAAQSRGVAMSLVAFAIMLGGGTGTYIGGRIVAASSLTVMYEIYAAGLVLLIGAVILNKRY
jgi:predicted MFS family arabinose efflux permease